MDQIKGHFPGKTNRGSIGEVVVLPPTIAFIVSEGPEWTKHCFGAI